MLRISLHITYDRRILLLLVGLGLALLLSASRGSLPSDLHASVSPLQEFVPTSSGRHVYLTADSIYSPVSATSACSSGYHMASFWEIMDVSNLVYDYDHPSAFTRDDSGRGLPSYQVGWVRTGYDSSTSNVAGTGNCDNWDSASSADYGSAVYLSRQWETVSSQSDLWQFASYSCALVSRVWCARDAYIIYLPLTIRG
jgi:hypothetical protein